MTYLPYLKDRDIVGPFEVAELVPGLNETLRDAVEMILRNEESELTSAQLEQIFAYTSGINQCQFCTGAHSSAAEAMGAESGAINKLLEDINTSGVEDKLKPIFHFAKKLALTPYKTVESDIQAIRDAGFNEKTIVSVMSVVALAAFCNRLVDGSGIRGDEQVFELVGPILRDFGYRI